MQHATKQKSLIKRGFSMIELIIVIAVLGVLTAVVLSQAQGMRESSNINKESSNLNMIVSSVRATFNSQGNFDIGDTDVGALNDIVTRNSAFPGNMINESGDEDIRTSWSNKGVHITTGSYMNINDSASFIISYRDVPGSSCYDFVERNYSSFFGVQVTDPEVDPTTSPINSDSYTGNEWVRNTAPSQTENGGAGTISVACDPNKSSVDIHFYSR